ncbi:hypothetical protein [Microbacterium marinilacus]|uniref:Uncharacterized protein n=1 Tax=Microbacterium marinilacus TaxID=415209 RepID=A0ABP7BCA2_9MICO|nr:hypothetical protein [Microbacterium marinilacus]MBY0686997.1 hypothetical protein [Microbacterium marinilacus]
MHDQNTSRLRLTLRLISVAAIVGICAAAVWFGFAAVDGSGGQMVGASALAAALGSGWSGAFAAISAKLKTAGAASA